MGELDELVSTLLGTFTSGIRLLKASRKRRRSGNEAIDTYTDKDEETPLIKSFKKSRSDIREAWEKGSIKAGPKFSEGDDALTETKHGRRKRDQNLVPTVPTKPTALGLATRDGWVRSKSSKKGAAKPKTHAGKASVTESRGEQKPMPSQPVDVVRKRDPIPMPRTATENRKSGFSFASDSTKLGEIPEHRLARLLATSEHNDTGYYMHTVAYPLAPYQPEPQKRRFGIEDLMFQLAS
ncbi:predicted protein [Sclerotinia sclerotiorum 1980 UF-70]|uniref:Uncharacterized protein n=1 Tax=Sclerotinia sclerotiorum (strain ATCC 18683 / 1980 / Ss-1) TaxID=665079 RepID=A7F4I2_SCLS1|nr:predicted protein [Sclerotinia sclerotiorum 1980 UF-70]EDN97653.1 predicted protein [Sclerotinia sclerotiorum 1980 UF-70]